MMLWRIFDINWKNNFKIDQISQETDCDSGVRERTREWVLWRHSKFFNMANLQTIEQSDYPWAKKKREEFPIEGLGVKYKKQLVVFALC
jgi:hypothetical protein